MNVRTTSLEGVLVFEPKIFGDDRGFFLETWNNARYQEHGLPPLMVQDNLSFSQKGVLRGLHYQQPHPQGKLVMALQGEIFDVAVDIRPDSPTRGQWIGEWLTEKNKHQLYIPPGFAHGFCVTSPQALVTYKCTELYYPEYDAGIRWDDPEIGIDWPITDPILSAKDTKAPYLKAVDQSTLPMRFKAA
ncbi:dTDP-4-dehydrorhamnose 3,5-epimerase [Planctomycetales bacterium 10988]|nr:dTDP-4-dehydrorhamnose 3,5-epimerase [Planctomycetales bacterium 10988]